MIEILNEEFDALKMSIMNSLGDLQLMIPDATREERRRIAGHIYHLENIMSRIIKEER